MMDGSKKTKIPKLIGEYILENSMFRISKLLTHENFNKSNYENDLSRLEDIDIGVCGNILFLIELIKVNPEFKIQKVLLVAGEDLMNHCKKTSRVHFGFYKGRAGVCYTLLKLFKVTGEKKYLDYSLELIKEESDVFIRSEFTTNRLYDGRSGLLLVLLHLYNNNQEYWILEKINFCLNEIVKDFVITNKGIIWNKGDKNIKPLNSYFFGSSGVAFTLIQLAKFFNDPYLLSMAKSIFVYEDDQWDNKITNWPDFRKEITTAKDYKIHRSKFLNKDYNYFTIPSESYDLAFGTTGLCLSRMSLVEYGEIPINKQDEKGVLKLQDFNTQNLSLANGISGVGSLYLEASKKLEYFPFMGKIIEIVEIINKTEITYQNLSLLYGITGIGYFLLQLIQPRDFNSVLFPTVSNIKTVNESNINGISGHDLFIRSLISTYPITFIVLHIVAPNQNIKIKQDKIQFYEKPCEFKHRFISELGKGMPSKQKQILSDIFELESVKAQMLFETKSLSMNHIKEVIKFEERLLLLNMEEDKLLNQTLVFDKDSQLVIIKWNWSRLNQPGARMDEIFFEFVLAEPKEINLLLSMNCNNEIIEEKLDSLGQLTRTIFQEPKMVKDAINYYLDAIEVENDTEKDEIISYIMQDIYYFIKKSLLHRVL